MSQLSLGREGQPCWQMGAQDTPGAALPVCRVLPLPWMAHTPTDSDDCCAPPGGPPCQPLVGWWGWEKQPGLEAPNLLVMAWLLGAGREGDPREKSTIDKSTPHTQVLGMAGLKVGYGPESQPGVVLPSLRKGQLAKR